MFKNVAGVWDRAKSAVQKGAALAVAALFGSAALMPTPALAQGGIADGVVTVITDANADVVLIGIAILALAVLIASIAWFKRAVK